MKFVDTAIPSRLIPLGDFIVVNNVPLCSGETQKPAVVIKRIRLRRARATAANQISRAERFYVSKVGPFACPGVVRDGIDGDMMQSVVYVRGIDYGISPEIYGQLR